MYKIVNFENIRYKLTASGADKLMRLVSMLGLKEKKQANTAISEKNWARKVSNPLKNKFLRKNFSSFK